MFLIDGHNLIPYVPGVHLDAIDDELQLIQRLQVFCRVRRRKVEVFFDQAPPGHAGVRSFGLVKAHFVRSSSTADQAIRSRLARLKNAARNWIVVSADRQVQASARAYHAGVLTSGEFNALLQSALEADAQAGSVQDGAQLSADELDEWLKLFGESRAGGDAGSSVE